MAENVESNDHDTQDNPMRSILKRRKKEEESEENPDKSVLKKPRTLSQDEVTTPQPRSILRKKSDNANENSKVTPKVETGETVKTSPVKIKTERTSDSSPPKKASEETRSSKAAAPKAADDDDDYGN